MERVIAFIDGFNLYHSIAEDPAYRKYKWLDLRKLVELLVPPGDLHEIYYFTALALWDPEKANRHKIYIRALESAGIRVVYGQFKRRDRFCPKCRTDYTAHEEKQTDVNIAIHLLKLAIEDRYDTALVLSGDSDLIPSVKAVKSTFASKRIGVVIPIGRRAEELKMECDFHIKLREKNLAKCLFDDPITLLSGTAIHKPIDWK